MNENEIVKTNEDDEISLVDLFAVVLRYRKLIIFGTIIVTILAGLYLYVLPKFKKAPESTVSVTYTVKVKALPGTILNSLPGYYNTTDCFKTYAERPQLLSIIFNNTNVFEGKGSRSETEYYSYINSLISSKQYEVKPSKIGSAYDVSFVVTPDKIDSTGVFMTSFVSQIESELENTYLPLLDDLKVLSQNSEKVMTFVKTAPNSTEKDINYMQDLYILGKQVEKFEATYTSFLEITENPYIAVTIPVQKNKYLVIAFIGSFMIFVFIAFLLNAIENIKADPEASKTISEAWNSGKSSKK